MPKKTHSRPISPLYARYFTSEEKKSLRAVPVDDLASEINLVRVVFAHFMKSLQSAPKDIECLTLVLRTSLVLGEQFARLVRAQNARQDPLAELQGDIEQALRQVRAELGID